MLLKLLDSMPVVNGHSTLSYKQFYLKKVENNFDKSIFIRLFFLVLSIFSSIVIFSQTWTASGSTTLTNPTGYSVSGVGTYYRGTTGGTQTASSNVPSGTICNGSSTYFVTGGSTFYFLPSIDISGFVIYGNAGSASSRTFASLATSTTLNGTYTTVSTASGSGSLIGSGTTTSCGANQITISAGTNISAGTYIRVVFSGNPGITSFNLTPAIVSAPTTQASSIVFSSVSYSSITASWTNGNGASRAVFIKEGTSATVTPTDGTNYTASTDWASKGSQIGSTGYYCVYNGTGSSVTLSNLNASSTYNVQVFEYNGTGTATKYLTTTATNNPSSQSTPAAPVFYYYRSKQSGTWSDANSWESSTDNATWGSAGGAPTGTSGDLAISIQNGHSITIDAGTVSADELTVANGGTLTVASGATLSITNGSGTDLTVASGGNLVLAGSFASATGSTITVNGTFENQVNNASFNAGSGSMTISAGGTYKVNGYNGSAVLVFTNVNFTSGIGALGSNLYIGGLSQCRIPTSQNGNVIINTPTVGGTYLNGTTTITGNLSILGTVGINHGSGGAGRALTVSGNLDIQGGKYIIAASPSTASSSLTVNGDITISGGSLIMSTTKNTNGSGTINVKGNINYSAGKFMIPDSVSSGHIVFNGTSLQTVSINSTDSTLVTQNLTISNAAGVTITGSKTFDVKGKLAYTVSNATLTTGNKLKLISTASSSASISDLTNAGANTGNVISGNVTLQQWVTGQRGYRILSNPFTTSLTPSNVGTANGITITGASDVKTYNTSTNTWTGSVSSIAANTPYSVFIRGLASEVSGLVYSAGPTAFAYNVTGTLNGNSVTLNQDNSSATAFTIIGNPFAAPVNSSALTGGTAGTPYYIYSMAQNNTGTRVKAGGWVAASSNSSTTTPIPMMGVVAYQAGTGASSTFSVASTSINTTDAAQTGLFGEGDATTQLELQVAKDGIYQDKLFVRFDANSTEKGVERMDLAKLNNDVTNIYTITSDKARLAVDARKGIDATIPVGITSPVGKYTFTVASNNFVNASNVYLVDKLTNTKTALEPGATYSFEITSDAATQGDNRFELGTVKTQVQDAVANDNFSVKVLGNVVNNAVTVQVRGAKSSSVQITVVDMQGKLISNTTTSREMNNINVVGGSGMYLIKVTDGENSIVSKVVKP